MKRLALFVASLACAAAHASDLLPPSYVGVTLETSEVTGLRVEIGKHYSIYVMLDLNNSYSALLLDEQGTKIYEGVPVVVEDCRDTALFWPDSANAAVRLSKDPEVAQLVVPAARLNPCILVLDLPLKGREHKIPARPNPGIPD